MSTIKFSYLCSPFCKRGKGRRKWKEHFSRQIESVKTSTGSASAWAQRTDAKYLLQEELRVARSLQFLTSLAPKANLLASEKGLSNRERLKDSTAISELFSKKSDKVGIRPLLLFYRIRTEGGCSRFMVTVSKKKFKRAVHRNRIKRLMREAYRLEKVFLSELNLHECLDLALVYTGDNEVALPEIRLSLRKSYETIAKRLQ